MATEIVYNDRDNSIDLILKADGVVVDIRTAQSGITRMDLVMSATLTISSDDSNSDFDWDTEGDEGKLIMNLGACDIPAGSYNAYLVVYDPSHDDGLIWTRFRLKVLNELETFG